ncbi:serine/threonine dehydratase family protein NDAI_0K02950 [Naumovozyma dairenensis CBS 421]|uniref:L-serine ammonia-lyase n=1 Tax=Naumovozyma dairenensis (strain ATCC 10597 / BCRC 20456 / CBS 421 / NBRC 0211 / NRRL Y-12639) TaxID=1071378 RepID=G0WI75_NAUDC|nr:hypothetical protein NDAI_0K02950 [Naumovozyma dairenensis CBS 421]CCD27486.1 hypothetical protein NDAI_0K02950 [Naumovozyma dairenensis CBS 421]
MSFIYNKTPLLRQTFDSAKIGPRIFLKYENLQPSGSFKSRGIGCLILQHINKLKQDGNKTAHVFSSSGGNAGLAAATASRSLQVPCTVVVPKSTKERMVNKIRKTGASVLIKGDHWKEADDFLRKSMKEMDNTQEQPIYVHPFDDPVIWEGHSTIIDEIVQTLQTEKISIEKVKGIICSVGGGGLFNGIIKGLERHNLAQSIPVIAVETKGCDVLNKSLKNGTPVQLPKITSVATSLGSTYISSTAFENAMKYNSRSITLNDKDVLETCLKYNDDFSMTLEPACGASVHLAYNPGIVESALGTALSNHDIVIVVLCGGSSCTLHDLESLNSKLV